MKIDKEIIDGVDVNECKYFCKFTTICRNENIGRVVRPRCKNVVDCYFKQLKRAEQKLEKIKDYCLKNKVAGWVDIEGIVEIIEDKENV